MHPHPTPDDNKKFFWYLENTAKERGRPEVVCVTVHYVDFSGRKSRNATKERANAYEVVFTYRGTLSFFTVLLDGTVVTERGFFGQPVWGPKVEQPEF